MVPNMRAQLQPHFTYKWVHSLVNVESTAHHDKQADRGSCDLFRNSTRSRRASASSLCPQSRSSRQQTTAARQPALSRTRQGRSCYVMLPWHCNHDGTLAMNPDAWCIHVGERRNAWHAKTNTLSNTMPMPKTTCPEIHVFVQAHENSFTEKHKPSTLP